MGFNLPLPASEEWSKYKTRTDKQTKSRPRERQNQKWFRKTPLSTETPSLLLPQEMAVWHLTTDPLISAPTSKHWRSRVTPIPMATASKQEAEVLWTTGHPHSCHPTSLPSRGRDACKRVWEEG